MMKKFRSVIAVFLAVLMIFTLGACGGSDAEETVTSADEAATPDSALVTDPDPVKIGDCTIDFLRAEKYVPFEDGESLLIHCKFTNNGTENTTASEELFISAKCGEDRLLEMDYQEKFRPEGYENSKKSLAPGESVEMFYIINYVKGIVEVTIQDIHGAIPEKLVFNVDTTTLG